LTQVNEPKICDGRSLKQEIGEQIKRYGVMASKKVLQLPTGPSFRLNWGQERTGAAMALQQAVLES
jgi:hypothetical protein